MLKARAASMGTTPSAGLNVSVSATLHANAKGPPAAGAATEEDAPPGRRTGAAPAAAGGQEVSGTEPDPEHCRPPEQFGSGAAGDAFEIGPSGN